MKANQKARDKQAVSSVFATMLVLPILIAIISALYMLAGSLIDKTEIPHNITQENVEKLKNSDIVKGLDQEIYFWKDSFEGNKTQWYNITGPNSHTKISNDHYWKNGKSLEITTGPGETCGIKTPFAWRGYKQVQIEISFTIHPNEKYKNFSITLGNYTNNGNISINVTDNNVSYLDNNGKYRVFEDNAPLHIDQHCWHNIKLIIDFEKGEYHSFILNGKTYDLSGTPLNYSKPKIGHESIIAQYTNFAPYSQSISSVDDFVIRQINKINNYTVTFSSTTNLPSTFFGYIGGASFEDAESIAQTSDGGYIIGASTYSFGVTGPYFFSDFYILKLDSSANIEWQKTIGYKSSSFNGHERIKSIKQTTDGGYIVAGTTYYPAAANIFLVKLDSSGSISWHRNMSYEFRCAAHSVEQTTDGGYIVAGYSYKWGDDEDIIIIKLDSAGNIIWEKGIEGGEEERANDVKQTTDGGYIITGQTNSSGAGEFDIFVLKLNSTCSITWQKTIGSGGNESSYSIQQTSDGGYILLGRTSSIYPYGSYIIKLDPTGVITWEKTIDKCIGSNGEIKETSDGGFIVVTQRRTVGVRLDIYLTKLDSTGNIIWQKTVDKTSDQYGMSVIENTDGDFVVLGYGYGPNEAIIIKFDENGYNCDPDVKAASTNISTTSASDSAASFSTYDTTISVDSSPVVTGNPAVNTNFVCN